MAIRPHDVFMSYKTAPIPALLRLIHAAGVGAEVISDQELTLALSLGVPGRSIIYNGPVKSDDSLYRAAVERVRLINVNHREEIPRIERAAARAGNTVQVGIRVNCAGGWAGQFGEPAGEAVVGAARDIIEARNLELAGIHIHLGHVGCREEVARIATAAADAAAELSSRLAISVDTVDIAGGLWTPTVRELRPAELKRNALLQSDLARPSVANAYKIRHYVRDAHACIAAEFGARGLPLPQIIMEPGRALVGDAQMLITQVKDRRAGEGRDLLFLDAGINIADPVRGEFHEIFSVKSPYPASRRYKLVGPICVPTDSIRSTWYGPEVERGDYLVIMDTGAYFVPWSNSFSFPRPAIVSVEHDRVKVIRSRESLAYLTQLDLAEDV